MSRIIAVHSAAVTTCASLLAPAAWADVLTLSPKLPLPHASTPAGTGRLSIDPRQTFLAESALMSGVPVAFDGLHINNFLGADRFYSAGVTGQGTTVFTLEPGHIWNGHVTLPHVTNFITGTGALGETDRHATAIGMAIGGRKYPINPLDHQTGIALNTDLRSAATATSWNPAPTGPPRYSQNFNVTSDSVFSACEAAVGVADVMNVSWAYTDPTGTDWRAMGLDGLARANPGTTFTMVAGNGGPAANSVRGPGSGYNSITVANLDNPNNYDIVREASSRGPQDYSDPVNGLVPAARVAVDIAAPGTTITSAYYGGETGGNSPVLGGSPGGPAGSSTYYVNFSGTSFATAIVSGAAALLDSASYNTPALAANANSRDARVIKSVLLNAATKIPGWNNGQAAVGGIITTSQALDYAVGTGRLNIGSAYDQYLAGTTDVAGAGGGTVQPVGWDFGTVAPTAVNDYVITDVLAAGTTFNATLSWFRERTFTDASTMSDDAYRDLDLEVWDATFTTLIAQSVSRYENVEHLSFLLPSTGQYGLRVRYFQTLFGTAAGESYGLSWVGTIFTQWQKTGSSNSGDWGEAAHWTVTIPDALGASATFGSHASIDGNVTVNVDAPRTVGTITFDNATYGYDLVGSNLIMINGPGINVSAGSHQISAPLAINSAATLNVAAGSTLTASNLQPTAVSLTKSGAGTLAVNNVRTSGLTVGGGTLRILPDSGPAGVSKVGALTVAAGAKIDLTDNKLITSSALGTWDGSAYTGVPGLVDAGRGNASNAQWDGFGIVTSDTRAVDNNDLVSIGTGMVGAFRNIADTATTTFAGQTVLGSDVVAMVTWGGDANLDGKINIDDYGQIDFNVGSSGSVFGWYNGDFNYDGKINIDDYGIIDFNVVAQGAPFTTAGGVLDGSAAVPEPAGLVLFGLAPLLLQRRRRPGTAQSTGNGVPFDLSS